MTNERDGARAASPTTDLAARFEAKREDAGVTLADLHAANIARQAEWCPDQVPDLSFRGNELGGECGEAQNVIKKLERERLGWRGSRASLDDLAQELADVVICADLCAVTAGIDLGAAVVAKFNATSEKVGLTTKLAAPEARDMARAGAAGGAGDLSAAAADVLAERRRQVDAEGWTPKHDDAHRRGEMATAAACYAKHAAAPPSIRHQLGAGFPPSLWPWDDAWWKPIEGDRRRDLVKAGALILAEIERLDRACAAAPPPPAQQGSSSPPRQGETVGISEAQIAEMDAMSAMASPGVWSIWPERIFSADDAVQELTAQVAKTDPLVGSLYLLNAEGKCPATTGCGQLSEANAHFIAALVNAYRAGHLVPASLATARDGGDE